MVRDLNNEYLDKLHDVFPATRRGPLGDSAKVNCATCHQGVFKPLYGVSMVTTFPELQGPTPAYVAPVAAPVPATPPPPAAVAPSAPSAPPAPATPAPAAEPVHPL